MPSPEKFPKPKRLHQKHRMENVVRPRPDYRRLASLPEPEDTLARKRVKDAKEAKEATERSKEHGEDPRISLPPKPARLGNIFGNMRTSDPVGRTKKGSNHKAAEQVFTAHKIKPQPFFSGQPRTNLPVQIQRFLQEPSLVSFGDRQLRQEKDDLDWVDADVESFDGVSERAVRQDQPRRKLLDKEGSCRLGDLVERMEVVDEISEHPSQQSTQVKRKKFTKSPRQLKKVADEGSVSNSFRKEKSRLVSRACSPIIIIPDDEQIQYPSRAHISRETLRVRNEAVQTSTDEYINQSTEHYETYSDPSLADSVKLDLPQTQKDFYEELGLDHTQEKDFYVQYEQKRKEKEKVRSETRHGERVSFGEAVPQANLGFMSAPAIQEFPAQHGDVLRFRTQQNPKKRSERRKGRREIPIEEVPVGNFNFNPTPVFHDTTAETSGHDFHPHPEFQAPVERNAAFQPVDLVVDQRSLQRDKEASAQDVFEFLERATSGASHVRQRPQLPVGRAKTVNGYSTSASPAPQNVLCFLDGPHTEVREYLQGSNESLPRSKTSYQFAQTEQEMPAGPAMQQPEVERIQKVEMERSKTSHRLRVYPRKMF